MTAFRLPPKTDVPLTSVSFFVPGIPTGHGLIKTNPHIGKTLLDGLYTLAKAGPAQEWKHALVYGATPFVRNAALQGPLKLVVDFYVPTLSLKQANVWNLLQTVIETLLEVKLVRDRNAFWIVESTKSVPNTAQDYYGAKINISHFDPR